MGPLIRVSKILAAAKGRTKVDRNPVFYRANHKMPFCPQEAGVDKGCKGGTNRGGDWTAGLPV